MSEWIEPIGVRLVPANFGPLKEYQAHATFKGPCGDTMTFWAAIDEKDGKKILQASFTTDGCQASIACGSACAHLCTGKSVEEAMNIHPDEILCAVGLDQKDEGSHCALLATRTLCMALGSYNRSRQSLKKPSAGCDESCCETCQEECEKAVGEPKEIWEKTPSNGIKRSIIVLSGKGGVGKSTVAAHLALEFAAQGLMTGLLDVDLHGPSVPKLLGLEGERLHSEGEELLPLEMGNLKVMSMGFALKEDQAAIWRGPMKASVVDQFVNRTRWENLDVLVVDCPPGTGDEPLSLVQSLKQIDGAIIVTTPQELAILDAQKAITFCRELRVPVLGVVENMSGLTCPNCQAVIPVFSQHGGRHMASDFSVPFLGSIPLDPRVSGEDGRCQNTPSLKTAMQEIAKTLELTSARC